MNAPASPFPAVQPDTSLDTLLKVLAGQESKALFIAYDSGQLVQSGFHVTEVKAGTFVTLDCGGNPDQWQETILQVEDIPAVNGEQSMTVGKFKSILNKVSTKVPLKGDARVTLEISCPDQPMRIYDVAGVRIDDGRAVLRLGARPAICKPRHREEQAVTACCGPVVKGTACCA